MRVLLPIDGNEDRAVKSAEAVISLPNAAEAVEAVLLNVQKRMDVTGEGAHVSSDEWYDAEDFPASVERAVELLKDAGIAVEKRREHGDPAEEILNTASEIDAGRIIMCGRKRTPVGKVLFGSVTQSVLLNSDVPVTVIAY
jgi:nucleotide-binding universal stress UspA family protein